jgi:hypothetical protein
VIGGPGAFVVPVYGWDAFAPAIKRKMVLEIAGLPRSQPTTLPQVTRVQADPPYDCMAGEKIWERNRRYFENP